MFSVIRNVAYIHRSSSKINLHWCSLHQPLFNQNNIFKKVSKSSVRCFQQVDQKRNQKQDDNQTKSIVPYLKLMRLDKPIGTVKF